MASVSNRHECFGFFQEILLLFMDQGVEDTD